MDPFEEFEFKPLTEGLGFHGKEQNKDTSKNQINPIFNNKNTSTHHLEFQDEIENDVSINSPLPRENTAPQITPPSFRENKTNETVDDILKTLQQKKKFEFKRPESFINEEVKIKEYLPATFDLSAAILDSMLIIAAYLLSLIMMLVITRVDLFSNLLTPDENGFVYIALAAHFAALTWIYLVANRLFLGCTPGEWVFDQMLGNPDHVGNADYSLRVALRSTLIIATGVFILPIISLITGKDFVGQISGIHLFKRP